MADVARFSRMVHKRNRGRSGSVSGIDAINHPPVSFSGDEFGFHCLQANLLGRSLGGLHKKGLEFHSQIIEGIFQPKDADPAGAGRLFAYRQSQSGSGGLCLRPGLKRRVW